MKTTPSVPSAARRFSARVAFAAVLTALSLRWLTPGASAAVDQISDQAWTDIAQATGNGWMQFPRAYSFDVSSGGSIVKKILVNWQTNGDVVQFPMTHGWTGSLNGGASWTSPAATNSPELDLMSLVRRNDGTLVAIPFYPNPNLGAGYTSFTFSYKTSTDNGATWVNHAAGAADGGVVNSATAINGFRFHRGIIEESDGSLYAAAYLGFVGDTVHRAALLKSTDGGITWSFLSTIQSTAGVDYTETTVARCKDGSFLAVMRSETSAGLRSLVYRRSTSKGVSWDGATSYLPGLPTNAGVDPYLWLMPNGILVLSYGDHQGSAGRDVHLAFSVDGNGAAWTNDLATFTGQSGVLESTGYTAIVPITAHRFMQVSDTGGNAYYASQHPSPNPFSVRSKIVDLVLTNKNRIDLAAKYSVGAVTITTDLTYADSAHPEAQIAAAFDGSTDTWSGAFKSATTGTYTIDLQQNFTLNAIGVCLHTNRAESATIDYSTNGTTWTTAKTYTNAIHNAIDYTTLATPITARYVRVSLTGASSPVCLNEIELYSTADTFENYAQNVVPYGYSAPNFGFWVSEGITPFPTGYQSKRALAMNDSTSANITIQKTTTATTSKTLEFRLRPKAYATSGSIQWRLLSGSTNAFRVAVFPDGSIKYYNGSAWVSTTGSGSPAGAGTAPLDTWSLIKVVASASSGTGTLYVNGVLKGTVGKETTVASLNGFMFASSGSAAVGDQALFDDVSF